MKINEVSAKLQIPSSTLRYYESLGLVESKRRANGYRDYAEREVAIIEFVVNMTKMGFSLNEVKSLIGLRGSSANECQEFSLAATKAKTRIDEAIKLLSTYKAKLEDATNCCTPQASVCEFLI